MCSLSSSISSSLVGRELVTLLPVVRRLRVEGDRVEVAADHQTLGPLVPGDREELSALALFRGLGLVGSFSNAIRSFSNAVSPFA
jgi:hypothetical protein